LPNRGLAEGTKIGAPTDSVQFSPHRYLPYLALAIGLAGLGLSAIFVKWANVPGAVSGFYRMVIAAGVMIIPFGVQARQRAPLSRRHVLFAVIAGLFFAGDLTVWNTSVLMTNAANATLFGNTSPFWVAFGALILFKEKLRPLFWGGLVLAMLGVTVILGEDFFVHPVLGTGDLLALLGGFFYGMFFLATERARDKLSSLASWWISAAVCTMALLVLTFLFRQPLSGYPMESFYSLIALALITQVVGWLAINYALGHLPASVVSPTLLGQPVITAIAGVPLLGQALSAVQLAGGALVLAGIYIVHRSKG
jgi:drug/metabolite transporter (DMT)-like permease